MSWREFSYLINGLSGNTPLGTLISIRAEKDPDRIKEFTPDMKKIRSDYLQKKAKKMAKADVERGYADLEKAFLGMVGKL